MEQNNTHKNSNPQKPVGCFKIILWIFGGIAIITLLATVAGLIARPSEEERERIRIENEEKIKAEKQEQIRQDSIAKVEKIANLPNEIRETIENVKNTDFSNYRNSSENLQSELILFNNWRIKVEEFENITTDNGTNETKELINRLKKEIKRIQSKEFPILRKEYIKEAKKLMWEHDIDVSGSSNNTSINFTGGTFAANRNIKEFYTETSTILNNFRFKRANFRWYKGADEYSYYEVYEGKDSDLFELKPIITN